MKAIVFEEYGPPDVLQLKEVEKPRPKAKEILIRIHAASVNFGDLTVRNFKAISPRKFNMPFLFWLIGRIGFGLQKPNIHVLGSEFAGIIEAVGKDVKRFKKGDQVLGYCGPRMGAYAEYLCMPEDGVVALKPANMNYAEAATVPYGAIMALGVLRKTKLQPGQKVLVNGASGGIGPAVVQLAKYHFGANVTGVCSATRREYVKSLGADRIIDYAKEDFSDSGEKYDLIIDILGKASFDQCKRSLKPKGCCVLVSFKTKQVIYMLRTLLFGKIKIVCALISEKAEDLVFVTKLIEAGKFKSIIDKCYPMERAADAHEYAEKGQKTGGVVIYMNHTL